MTEYLQQIDQKILLWVNGFSGGALDYPMNLLAYLTRTHWMVLVACLGILIFVKHDKLRFIIAYTVPMIVIKLLIMGFKLAVSRPRPFVTDLPIHLVEYFGRPSPMTSFPSGHSALAFASAALLSGLSGGKLRILYILALAVALGRMYLGVHYPSDVLAGSLMGWLLGISSVRLAKKYLLK